MEDVSTFISVTHDASQAMSQLDKAGLNAGGTVKVDRLLLDTFDGRLHAMGLRLEYRRSTNDELILIDRAGVAARVELSSPFRQLIDLAPGPFRSRLAEVVEPRALTVTVALRARASPVVGADKRGKVILSAWVYDQVQIVGRPDTDAPVCIVELHTPSPNKPSEAVSQALIRQGWQAVDGDALTGAAAVSGVDLSGFASRPTVALAASDRTIDGVIAVLKALAHSVDATWQGTVDEIDTEFLHDLRVAIRRSRAVLSNTKRVLPTEVHERASALFAQLGHGTSEARDLDVQVRDWEGSSAADAVSSWELAPVRARLENRRREAHEELNQLLSSGQICDEMTWWTSWLDAPERGGGYGPRAKKPLGTFVAKRIARAQRKLLANGRAITAATPDDEVHEFRKEAKNVRYLFECFGTLLPKPQRKVFVKRLKALQDNLGDGQDARAQYGQLAALARELHGEGVPPDTLMAIGQLCEQLDRRRLDARAEFGERFAAYESGDNRKLLDELLGGLRP